MVELIIVIIIGCIAVSIFDGLGAILSRTLNFNYMLLTIGSIIIYGTVAFYAAKIGGVKYGILASALVGIFDATVGLFISKKLKANIPNTDVNMDTSPTLVLSMAVFAAIIGGLTILITQ